MNNQEYINKLKEQHIKNDKKRLEKIKHYQIEIIEYKEKKDKENDNINELERQIEEL
jgi:hypothetical protein